MDGRIKYEENGEELTPINYYNCDFCGVEMCQCGGSWVVHKGKDICIDCANDIFKKSIRATHWIDTLMLLKGIEHEAFFQYRKRRINLAKWLREKVLHKYKFTCQNCGSKTNLSIDHIKPVRRGGKDTPDNLTVLCKSCNSKKGAKYED